MKLIQLISFITLFLMASGIDSSYDTFGVGAVAAFLAACAVLLWSTREAR